MNLKLLAAALAASLAWTPLLRAAATDEAQRILSATSVTGGLIVHLGCGDGTLTAALRANNHFIVHGLDADAKNIEKARRQLESLGLYGKVSVEQWSGERLPYTENLVNLLVAESPGAISTDEMLRVLAPLGAAYVKTGAGWEKIVKPRPKEIDEWTHFLHGPDNNAVAHDAVSASPHQLQWLADPSGAR